MFDMYSFAKRRFLLWSFSLVYTRTYGKTKLFYKNCNIIFLGGSLINHGGQNPLEAARFGCSIISGYNVDNFREIYRYLRKNNISIYIKNKQDLVNKLIVLLKRKDTTNKIKNKIKIIGDQILKKTYDELFVKN